MTILGGVLTMTNLPAATANALTLMDMDGARHSLPSRATHTCLLTGEKSRSQRHEFGKSAPRKTDQMKQETFAIRLSKLSDAATQGEWDIIVGNDLNLSERDMNLAAYLANRRREILALVETAHQASFCLRELLPDDIDAKMTAAVLDAALANLDRAQEGKPNVPE